MGNKTFLCPDCGVPLVLRPETKKLDFILMTRVECEECEAEVIIEDDVPRLPGWGIAR